MPDEKSFKNNAEQLLSDLRRRHRKLTRESLLSLLFLSAGIVLGGFSLLVFAEQALYLTPVSKTVIWALIVIAATAAAWRVSAKSYNPSFTRFYRSFCEKHDFRGLENALDLYLDPEEKKSGLHILAIERNLQDIDYDRFRDQLHKFSSGERSRRIYVITSVLLLTGILAAGTASWLQTDALDRTLGFWEEFERPNPWEYVIAPGDTTIEHGSSFQPEIEILGSGSSLPGRVTLAIKTDIEDEYRLRPMEKNGERTFTPPPLELTNDASWHVVLDEFESDHYQVNVQLRPRFENLVVHVVPPAYTGLEPFAREYPFAQLRAYGGSEITIKGTYNKPVRNSVLHMSDDSLHLESADLDSLSFETSFTLVRNDTIRFSMDDIDGLSNQNPFRFTVTLLEDEYPVVAIHEPGEDLIVPEPERVDILYQASDDFGLTRAELHWELERAFTTEPMEGSMSLDRPVTGETRHIPWELDEFDLRPRDQLTFWITVWDNDEYNGYKMSSSQQIKLEVPSLSAWLDDVSQRERNVQDALDEVSESHSQMEQEYERFRERLSQNQEPGWEEEQMLDDIREQHREMDEAVNNLNEQFEEIRREIESSSQVSDDTRRAYNELQDLMEQLDDPDLLEALEELREAMQSLNSQEMQRALEDFEFNDQLYKERLERTLELFKTLKMNSDLDRLAAQYEDLADRMQEVSAEEKSLREQNDEQQSVRDDTESLERQLDELDSRPPRRSEEKLREMKEESLGELREIQERIDELISESRVDAGREGMQEGDEGQQDGDDGDQTPGSGQEDNGDGNDGSPQAGQDGDGDDGQAPEPGQDEDGHTESENGGQPSESGQDMDPRQQEQQQISEQFQARADALRQEQQQMSGQQIQVNILALQQSLYTLLELSEVQEELSRQTGQTDSRSQGYVELARNQQNISSQFSKVADTLYQVSSEIPGLSSVINTKKAEVERTLSSSVSQMSDRDQRMSVITSRESLGGINELASLIAEAIDQLMDQQGGAGSGSMSLQQMIDQMQNMSGDQEMMNQQLQDLINDAQGERLTREQSERLEQLARQQNEIRRQLQELQRSGALRQGDRALSDLQRMSEEMEDAINDMRGGMTDPLMSERQQNILSRMLDAEESLQERGESEEYEGRSPDEFDRTMPPDISLEEIEQEIRARLQDPQYTRFHDDYQRLIERYFDLLRRMEGSRLP